MAYTVRNEARFYAARRASASAGGHARWAGTTPAERSEHARRAVRARWARAAAERENGNGGPAAA
ncbi:hypothetical protein [Actinosynnema pretiosum]|uniref:hypothetical protein n=1 Tax=Actinosynnema pretiosum TaxID=42197 RepID=UPI0012FD6F2B|nr:hypothetical protein [Actinosynnema pretiosum]